MNISNNVSLTRKHVFAQSSCNRKTVNFGSKNSPIDSFIINTQKESLFVEELKKVDEANAVNFKTDFYIDNFPSWAEAFPNKESIFNLFKKTNDRALNKPDGNTTILVAKNAKNKIVALFSLEQFDDFYDTRVGYIRDCLINKEYKSQGIGKILIERILQTAKGYFTDVYLESEQEVSGFYSKIGFDRLDSLNNATKKLYEYIKASSPFYKNAIPMSININPKDPWWSRYTKYIH